MLGHDVDRRGPIRRLCKIDVQPVVSGDELRYDKIIPLGGCFEERRTSIYVSVVDVELHA